MTGCLVISIGSRAEKGLISSKIISIQTNQIRSYLYLGTAVSNNVVFFVPVIVISMCNNFFLNQIFFQIEYNFGKHKLCGKYTCKSAFNAKLFIHIQKITIIYSFKVKMGKRHFSSKVSPSRNPSTLLVWFLI